MSLVVQQCKSSPSLNITTVLSDMDSYHRDKTVVITFYLYIGNAYNGKATFYTVMTYLCMHLWVIQILVDTFTSLQAHQMNIHYKLTRTLSDPSPNTPITPRNSWCGNLVVWPSQHRAIQLHYTSPRLAAMWWTLKVDTYDKGTPYGRLQRNGYNKDWTPNFSGPIGC